MRYKVGNGIYANLWISKEPYDYEIDFGDGVVTIHIVNKELKSKLRASSIWSYNGRTWIKNSGGRALTLKQIVKILNMPKEIIALIRAAVRDFSYRNYENFWREFIE